MGNIHFICGKTKDGNPITLDGFRVESFAVYSHVDGDTFVYIYFKSGSRVTVYAYEGDCPESIPDSLNFKVLPLGSFRSCRNLEVVANPLSVSKNSTRRLKTVIAELLASKQ